ncbi:MAG: hypothetical protein COW01_05465 [Bdellovibrionales bacterium CG12_big_fil_rev_8_21_14_0_65_38_15]|nr:MAG: hypothetical protein COW01_05465 [Bdellovibrionales bacterium CG12_big_fil_rev_8_21_14_0_65_38_15]
MVIWRVLTFIFFSVLMIHISPVGAQQFASVPLTEQRMPSDDLSLNGRMLRPDEAYQLAKEGLDLSTLDPVESALWSDQSQGLSQRLDAVDVYDGDEVKFAGSLLSASGMFRFNIQNSQTSAIVHLDKTLHTLLLRKNILRLLGYKVPAIKWVARLKVQFESKEEMDQVTESQIPRATLGAASRWIESKDEDSLTIIFRDIAVTVPSSSDHYNLAMGVPPQTLTNRTLRSLIIPYALLDLGESANKFEWTVGRKDNNAVILPHFTRGIFATTADDAKWILRRLEMLSKDDLRQAIELAHFPLEVSKLLVEKISSRRNALLEHFSEPAVALPFEVEVSHGDYLKKGKLELEDWDGYASRFAHGDPESPFKDVHWYALSKIQAFAIDNLVARANQELSLFNPNQVRGEFHQQQFQEGLEHFIETGYIMDFPVGTWFSPVADINLTASRDVVVGNYLGTDNLVQLADSIGWGIQLGGQLGIENLEFAPTASIKGTVTLSKNWTHLKPLRSLKNVFKEPYKNIVVPLIKWQMSKKLDELADLRNSENPNQDWSLDEDDSELAQIVKHLNENLGVGESVLYTERVMPTIGASLGASLMGTPVHLSLSGSADVVDIRRIQIYKKDKKTLQIYDDLGHGQGWSLNVSIERLIPIIRLGWRKQKGNFSVRLHEIDLNPDVKENPRLFDKAYAVAEFLSTGSAELLEEIQKPNVVEADFLDKSSKFSFLFWRHKKLKSDTLFNIESRDGLKGKYVALTDEKQSGLNWEAFTKDIINYGFQRLSANVNWGSPTWQNPAQTIGGMGTTTSVRFETSLDEENHYNERFMRLSDRWEGWSKKVKKLKRHMRDANEKFGFQLFDERTLDNTDKLKLFDVTVNLNLYEAGFKKLETIHPNSLIYFEYLYEEARGIRERGCREEQIRSRRLSDGRLVESCGTLNTVIYQNNKCRSKIEDKKDEKDITKCLMRLYRDLYEDLDYKELKMLLGQDNLFVHGEVNGFRDNDEVLNDTIQTNTEGRIGSRFWNGPFEKIKQMLGIQEGELNGYWLRERL